MLMNVITEVIPCRVITLLRREGNIFSFCVYFYINIKIRTGLSGVLIDLYLINQICCVYFEGPE